MFSSTGYSTRGRAPIQFGTYNIRNGRNGVLESALRGVSQSNLDPGIFRYTKLTGGFYTRGSDGYSIVYMDTPIRHRGRVAVLYRPSQRYVVEAIQQFRPNIVGFQLAKGDRIWYISGCYLAPNDTSTIEIVASVLKERLRGSDLLVVGGLNANL